MLRVSDTIMNDNQLEFCSYIDAAKFNSSAPGIEILSGKFNETYYLYQNVIIYEGSGTFNDSSVLQCIYIAVNETSERMIAVEVCSCNFCVYLPMSTSMCVNMYTYVHMCVCAFTIANSSIKYLTKS